MVPITRRKLQIDMFADWDVPIILCARTALGTINHTLLSIEALRSRRMRLHGLIFVGDDNPDNMRTIARLAGARILGLVPRLDRIADRDGAAERVFARLQARGFCVSSSPIWHPFTQHAVVSGLGSHSIAPSWRSSVHQIRRADH